MKPILSRFWLRPLRARGRRRAVAASLALFVPLSGAFANTPVLDLGVPYAVPAHVPGAKVRTPEGPIPLLADRLGKQLAVQARAVAPTDVLGALNQQKVDAALLMVDTETPAAGVTAIPLGYRAGIMAIMRTDTDIHSWDALRGRTVCLAEGSGLAGQLQLKYGAIEKVHRAPADALLDLRVGGCDATVHDSTLLSALLEFPEWEKFSARLPVQNERDLAFVVPAGAPQLAERLRGYVADWRQSGLLDAMTQQSARDIAFEVYLDQEVPDCH